jgi:hypothetical protein
MKAKDKFFSVRYGWIKEGQEIPKAAMQEAAAAGVVSYKTKVAKPKVKHERDNQKQLERDAADSASVQASDNESGAESPSAVRGKWFAS